MPLTDIADLMDLMSNLLATAPLDRETEALFQSGPENTSLLCVPMDALNTPPRSYAEVFGPEGQMLSHLGAQADDPALAKLYDALAEALNTGAFDLPEGPVQAPRLVKYAYPVV